MDMKLEHSGLDQAIEQLVQSGAFEELKIKQIVVDLKESYKARAIGSLIQVKNSTLKGLLRRVVSKIFNASGGMVCCNEYKAGYASGRKPGKGRAG